MILSARQTLGVKRVDENIRPEDYKEFYSFNFTSR